MNVPTRLAQLEERYASRLLAAGRRGARLIGTDYQPAVTCALRRLHVAALKTRGLSDEAAGQLMFRAYRRAVRELRADVRAIRDQLTAAGRAGAAAAPR
jgi:hypothetical protein